jgi:hypothetical protein
MQQVRLEWISQVHTGSALAYTTFARTEHATRVNESRRKSIIKLRTLQALAPHVWSVPQRNLGATETRIRVMGVAVKRHAFFTPQMD